jgi:superfamily II DNA or RNA helicase
MLSLRGYQQKSFAEVRQHIREGKKRILLVAPTGSGKTVTSSHLIAGAHKKGNEAMFLAHRREIIYQTADKLRDAEIEFNMVLSGHKRSIVHSTYLASIQTLIRREFKDLNVKVLIIDEAHHAVAETYKRIIGAYPDAIIIGLTATPCRGDGRGLGDIFEAMVISATVEDLIQLGHLVPPRIFNAEIPSAAGLHTRCGDYIDSELSERYNTPKLVGDIVEHWFINAYGLRTLVFATDIRHSLHITRAFNEVGVRAEHIDGETSHAERKAILARHSSGETTVLCNVGVATEGYDDPNIQAVILARRTKSFGLYLQMAGRGLRPANDKSVIKKHLILLDHADCWGDHGSPDESVIWTLDPEGQACRPPKKKEAKANRQWRCDMCGYVNDGGKYCEACGLRRTREARTPEVAIGKLIEVESGARRRKVTADDKENFWNECLWQCIHRKMKVGAAFHMYKKKFGKQPRGFREMPRGKLEWNMRADEFHRHYLNRGG